MEKAHEEELERISNAPILPNRPNVTPARRTAENLDVAA
jgi:hypothetical protein